MDEYFLQYLWKYQKFEPLPLYLVDGSELTVLRTGFQNNNAGPDFLEAKVKIDNIEWAGSIEVHHKSSDWYHHKHDQDKAYHNVILHVVYEHDQEVKDHNGLSIPTLEMAPVSNRHFEKHYKSYITQPKTILCEPSLEKLAAIHITSMLDNAVTARLEEKAKIVLDIAESNKYDWDETAYQLLAKNFGFSVNKEPFQKLAQFLPFQILKKHLHQPLQAQALLFGMSGLMEEAEDEYSSKLKSEFSYLKKKYDLKESLSRVEWKFSKLRPANFPTVRLAQFAQLLINLKKPFDIFINSSAQLKKLMLVELDDYWKTHYDFGKGLSKGINNFGQQSIENIMINTATPLQVAYSKYTDNQLLIVKAIDLLSGLKAENNKIIRAWQETNIPCNNAYDSQALIHQYNEFCLRKKCLQCNIGVTILHK